MADAKIVAGSNHSICLTEDGILYGWGLNSKGQLGIGNTDNKPEAFKMNAQIGERIIGIDCGDAHSVCLTESGRVFVWGDNSSHQLGLETSGIVTSPVYLDFLRNKRIVKIACGSNYSLAITEDNELYAWGDNSSGQLGNGTRNVLKHPTFIRKWDDSCTGIACGQTHSIAIFGSNLWVWGDNSKNQLGINVPGPVLSPYQVVKTPIENANTVFCGAYHTAVKTSAGILWTFGDNSKGQIGNNTTTPVKEPFNVPIDGTIKDYCCGMNFNVIVTEDGNTYVWGENKYGALMLDPKASGIIQAPLAITSAPDSVDQVMAGSYHTLFHGTQGGFIGVGRNAYGQVGDNTYHDTFNYKGVIMHP